MRHVIPLLGALCALSLPTAAHATLVKEETIEQMTSHAPLVVRATVKTSQALWTDDHRAILTWSEAQVTEVLKGQAPPTLLIKQPGGTVGAQTAVVHGAARFSPGQDCLLFLEPAVDERGAWVVYGLAAGKVDFEVQNGAVQAVRKLEGLAFQAPAGGASAARPVQDGARLGARDAFLERVRKAVKGGVR